MRLAASLSRRWSPRTSVLQNSVRVAAASYISRMHHCLARAAGATGTLFAGSLLIGGSNGWPSGLDGLASLLPRGPPQDPLGLLNGSDRFPRTQSPLDQRPR